MNDRLTVAAARALGHLGEQARPHLLKLLQTSSKPEVQTAAVFGLGHIGALTGDTRSTALLLKLLMSPKTDITVQTEIVWALGKAPDFAAYEPLAALEQQVWRHPSNDPHLKKLREAVDWSIPEVRQGGHTNEY